MEQKHFLTRIFTEHFAGCKNDHVVPEKILAKCQPGFGRLKLQAGQLNHLY